MAADTNICGFETGDVLELAALEGAASIQTTTVRTGTYALRCNPTTSATGRAQIWGRNATTGQSGNFNLATAFYRLYFLWKTKPGTGDEEIFVATNSGGTVKFGVRLTSDAKLAVYDSAGVLLATGATVLSDNVWYRVEIKVETGTSAAWEVRLAVGDGTAAVEVSSDISGTANLLTSNNARGFFGKAINRNSNTVDFYYDDIAIDSAGFPGPGKVTLAVATADGTFTAWTIGAGSGDKFQQIDEIPYDSDTTYLLSTATSGDAYTGVFDLAAALAPHTSINAVRAVWGCKRDGAGNGAIRLRLRSGAINSDTTGDVAIGAAYTTILLDQMFTTDPNTGSAWLAANMGALEAGCIERSANKTRLTAVYLMADVVPVGIQEVSMDGAVTPAGALSLAPTQQLAGATTPTGAVAKQPTQVFGGALTSAGAESHAQIRKRLWLPSDLTSPVAPAFEGGWTTTTGAVRRRLNHSKGASAIAPGTRLGWANTAGTKQLDRQYVSNPLDGAQSVGGSIKMQLQVREFANSDNVDQLMLAIKVVSIDGATVRGTVLALANYGPTAEFRSAGFRNKIGADGDASTLVDALDGDRIVVEIGYSNSTTGTTPEAQANYGEAATDLPEGDEAQVPDGAGWVEFGSDLAFQADPAGGVTAAGTIAPTGLTLSQIQLQMSGQTAPSGVLVPRQSVFLTMAGEITPSGLAIVLRVFLASLAGAVTSAGTVTLAFVRGVLTGGVLGSAGALIRAATQRVSGALGSSGAVKLGPGFQFEGEIGPQGDVANLHIQNVAMAGEIVPEGTLATVLGRLMGGVLGLAGSVGQTVGRVFTGVLGLMGLARVGERAAPCDLTLAELRIRVYERLDDTAVYYTVAEVNHALNAAQDIFALLTLCIERTADFTADADAAFHQISSQIGDFILPLRVTTASGARIRPTTLHRLNLLGLWRTPGTPTRYAHHGYDMLVLAPQFAAPTVIKLTYAASPAAMVGDTDLASIPAEQQTHLVDFALWWLRLKEGGQEHTNTGEYLNRFLDHAQKYADFVRARSKAQRYDAEPFDLRSFDRGQLKRNLRGQQGWYGANRPGKPLRYGR